MENKKYDLEDRTLAFAKACLGLIDQTKKSLANVEVARQLVRSSGSVGANYIEANESLSKKDFIYRIKVCRKEAKESTYWLKLLDTDRELQKETKSLIQESKELTKIFGAILKKRQFDIRMLKMTN